MNKVVEWRHRQMRFLYDRHAAPACHKEVLEIRIGRGCRLICDWLESVKVLACSELATEERSK